MSRSSVARTARRLSVVTAVVLAAAVGIAAPASAHVEVEAEGARALAENVTLDFTAESESPSAGITKLEVILPPGIVPADVTYKEGPKGWTFAATQRGYAVSGPAVAAGEGAAYAVTVRQLPDAKSLAFKTLQSYSDGRVDRWIELEEAEGDGHGHGNSAPVLALKAAAPGAVPVSPGPTAEPTTAAPSSTAPTAPADEAKPSASDSAAGKKDDGMSPALPVGIAVAVLALGGGGLWWFKRRGAAGA
ncbi:DUF1775 domain-containing protein [Streptomyces lunaelactis]|uniref:DUF1775 domain-containing protein n=4 Tax=Streptomyces lunaelactis TaxID=1535768 RepID=UPI001584F757|nr:DUF1775 domain-containing protein [Streptomyces lunaelactis]NUK02832.1 DUF1775 domain-containing protein [Streptomyces lunaelactis]NUK17176.1 DUF1775 domain-containing protein [Streptomyces lunaelactis]NUK43583.1 DUF1775 domain-containing protein [Streptomyces lunaelactis]NUL12558.1 DUF1775 domain-containing protein [Streptomyces lunaelactis]NUL23708.1 DUF1775 domain-containing protein [Streptomyces lunaelactis]